MMFTVKNYLNLTALCAMMGAASLLSSCDSNVIYEDLAPCENRHAIRFQWNRNMLQADAFAGNVKSVAVYGFDENGVLAFELSQSGDALAQQGYTLPLDSIQPGVYSVVAWCGLDNSEDEDVATRGESFHVSATEIGKTTVQELRCRMEREIENGIHYSREQLYDLYHGTAYGIEIYPKTSENTGDHVYTINLTKDTNNVRVMLQQMGNDVNVQDFSFCIEEANGTLSSDNELLNEDEVINYEPFHTENGVAQTTPGGTRAGDPISSVGVAMAEMKMSRLMADKQSVLTIRNSDGSRVLQIPMTDYALLGRSHEADWMTDQEYLDCQDSYKLMFFLDSNGSWISSTINIQGWTIYKQDSEFGK